MPPRFCLGSLIAMNFGMDTGMNLPSIRELVTSISVRLNFFFVVAVTIFAILQTPSSGYGLESAPVAKAASVDQKLSLSDIMRQSQQPKHLTFMGRQLTGFWSDQNPPLQQKIDNAFERIFSTPTGQSWLRALLFNSSIIGKALAGECIPDHVNIENYESASQRADSEVRERVHLAEQLSFFWGLSLPVARRIVGAPSDDQQSLGHHSVTLVYGDGRTEALPPKIYFFGLGQNFSPFDGYTTSDNKTMIMIDDERYSDARLMSILAHEAAITGDGKADLSAWASQRSYRDLQKWQGKLSDPAFNSIFATMRAFRAETMIFQDLSRSSLQNKKILRDSEREMDTGLKPYEAFDAKTCLQEYQRLVKAKYLTALGISDRDRVEMLAYLDSASTITRCDGTRVNACMEFARIEPGARVQNSSGPRPRVGSDW